MNFRKLFYTFAVALIALIITPTTAMRVSACADYDYDHITLSDRLANINPSLAEIDFDALLADVIQDGYEEGLFIVISMQEVYGQTGIVSVQVVNEVQLGLLFTYTNKGSDLLLIMPLASINSTCCANPNIIFTGIYSFFCPVRVTLIVYWVAFCSNCGTIINVPIYR